MVTLLAPLLVNGALCVSLAGRGVDEDPALFHAPVGRWQLVSALARLKRYHGRGIGLGQGGWDFASGCRNTGDPLHLRLGQLLKVSLTLEGAIGDQIGQAVGGLPLMHMAPNGLANILGIPAVATAWVHQDGEIRLVSTISSTHNNVRKGEGLHGH